MRRRAVDISLVRVKASLDLAHHFDPGLCIYVASVEALVAGCTFPDAHPLKRTCLSTSPTGLGIQSRALHVLAVPVRHARRRLRLVLGLSLGTTPSTIIRSFGVETAFVMTQVGKEVHIVAVVAVV
jgi:hypothetical protein